MQMALYKHQRYQLIRCYGPRVCLRSLRTGFEFWVPRLDITCQCEPEPDPGIMIPLSHPLLTPARVTQWPE